MRVLFLTSRLPYPPDRGDRVRAYNLLATISKDHEVELVSFVESRMSPEARGRLEQLCARVEEIVLPRTDSILRAAIGLFSGRPLQVQYYRDAQFSKTVQEMSRGGRYDVVFSHIFRVYPYARLAKGAYRILDLTDVVSREVTESARFRPVPMRWVYQMEGARIRRFEEEVCLDADEVWVISRGEKELLAGVAAAGKIRVVPNGLCRELVEPAAIEAEPGRLGFLGHLEVFHNLDGLRYFVESILPAIRAKVPAARLVVGGAGGSPILDELKRREGVTIQGYVHELSGFFRRCSVIVAPLRFAAGTQNKVIQGMAAGVPVLVSPEVARGIDAEPGKEMIVAASEAEWTEKAVELLLHPARARAIGDAGRKFALRAYDWEIARARMGAIANDRGAAVGRSGSAG